MPSSEKAHALSAYQQALEEFQQGNLQHSRDSAEGALQALSRAEGTSDCHELFFQVLLLLSVIYSSAGSPEEAERLLSTASGYAVEHLRADAVCLAAVSYNRAILLLDQHGADAADRARVSAAAALLREAERLLTDVLGRQRLLLADVWHATGVCHYLLGEFVPALEEFRRSMEVRVHFTDSAGATELRLALTMEHVAQLYRCSGRREEALHLLQMVAATRKQYLGSRHPLYAAALFSQGVLAAELNLWKRAEVYLALATETNAHLYPPEDLRVRAPQYWAMYM